MSDPVHLGKLNGLTLYEHSADPDMVLVELHGTEGHATVEVTRGWADGLEGLGEEIKFVLDEANSSGDTEGDA